jgi:hypothetical protein
MVMIIICLISRVQTLVQPVPRPGALHRLQQLPLRVRRARFRARLLDDQPQRARHLGGPIRRLQQHRPVHHRPVHLFGSGQVGAPERPRHAPPARPRGHGSRALQRPPGALPADVLRRPGVLPTRERRVRRAPAPRHQLDRRQLHHPGQLLPHHEETDRPAVQEAAHHDDSQESVASSGSQEQLRRHAGEHRVQEGHPRREPASQNPQNVKKVLFCTGKVYYDLKKARQDRKLDSDIAITRVEQVRNEIRKSVEQEQLREIFCADITVPIRFDQERVCQVPQRSAELGSGRAQEPGGVELRPAQIRDGSDRFERRHVSISFLFLPFPSKCRCEDMILARLINCFSEDKDSRGWFAKLFSSNEPKPPPKPETETLPETRIVR